MKPTVGKKRKTPNVIFPNKGKSQQCHSKVARMFALWVVVSVGSLCLHHRGTYFKQRLHVRVQAHVGGERDFSNRQRFPDTFCSCHIYTSCQIYHSPINWPTQYWNSSTRSFKISRIPRLYSQLTHDELHRSQSIPKKSTTISQHHRTTRKTTSSLSPTESPEKTTRPELVRATGRMKGSINLSRGERLLGSSSSSSSPALLSPDWSASALCL